jgi:hypothetical protein
MNAPTHTKMNLMIIQSVNFKTISSNGRAYLTPTDGASRIRVADLT